MLEELIYFILTGFELTFFSGVYGFCISNNVHFGDDRKGLIGISGMFIGAGEILGKLALASHRSFTYNCHWGICL